MAGRSSRDLVDAVLNGKLEGELRRLRARGLTFDQMAAEFSERGVEVSRETLRRWCKQYGINEGAAA